MAKSYLVGLVGEGIEHSLTPDLHMREAQHLGLEYEYRIIDSAEDSLSSKSIDWILAEAKAAGYDALNVTYPFKQQVISQLVTHSQEVAQLESSNLVLHLKENSRGENTDWYGFGFALDSAPKDSEREKVLQVGVGGAGSATAYALLRWGVRELTLADLNFQRAQDLAKRFGELFPGQKVIALPLAEALVGMSQCDGVVQATPVGMFTHPGLPFDLENLNPSAWVADVIYRPMETELISLARSRGNTVMPGGLMAIGQAAESLRLITGLEPDINRMALHFEELLATELKPSRAQLTTSDKRK